MRLYTACSCRGSRLTSVIFRRNSTRHSSTGFTIVELLIVIVVIAILVAITVVSYNGIQQRAQSAIVQSELEGAAKQLSMDQVTNSAYPATIAAANNGAGLKASSGTTYQYAVNNSSSPQTFCITATNGTTSYYVSSTNNVPTTGACTTGSNIVVTAPASGGVNTAYSGYVNITTSATGTPTPTAQWQRLPQNIDTGTWLDIAGQTSPSLSWVFGANYGEPNYGYFRAVYTNSSGSTASSPIKVTFYYAGD